MGIADKWNQKYASMQVEPLPAKNLFTKQNLLPEHGRALDVACGLGATAIYLAQRGLTVTAVDISSVALHKLRMTAQQRGLVIDTVLADVNDFFTSPRAFELIIVNRFLQRSLCASLQASLVVGGLLFYQTFTTDCAAGPQNPAYRLVPGELPTLFPALSPIHSNEDSGIASYIGRLDG